jgi:hypothetical protein
MDGERFQLKNVSRFGGQKQRRRVVFASVVKWLFAKPAFDHGMMKKGYFQLHQI